MKKTILFILIFLLAAGVQAQSKRLAAYYCSVNNEAYSLNFFTGNQHYFVYTDAGGKQTTFKEVAAVEQGEYEFTKTGNMTASLHVKKDVDDFPDKLKATFILNGKKVKLVFRKDDRGIVD